MKALRLEAGALRLAEVEVPRPREGQALVRVRVAGICNTDLELVKGYMGFEGTLGHELVGEVVEGSERWRGRRVCVDINYACGVCDVCQAGGGHHCPTRTVLGILGQDGAFATHLVAPEANLFAVPDGVDDDAAVFTEPLAAAFEILEQLTLEKTTRVLVLGDGKLGLLCAMALATTGCALTLVGHHPNKLARARGIATATEIPELGYDVVVEATGSRAGLADALRVVRPRGTVVLKSTFAGTPEVDTNRIVVDEIRLLGSRCGPFDRALEALAAGAVDPRTLVDARYGLEDGVQAMTHAATRGTLKVLLDLPRD